MNDIIDIVLKARPQGLSYEASNPRHEHEWAVFKDVKLPDGKVLIPGVIDSVTNFVEHPELVAQRIGIWLAWSAARTSLPAPIAASARSPASHASTAKSPGPSSNRWRKAHV